jgi:hypothetical protein
MFKKKIMAAITLIALSAIGLGVSTGIAHAQGNCYYKVVDDGHWEWRYTRVGPRLVWVPWVHTILICPDAS